MNPRMFALSAAPAVLTLAVCVAGCAEGPLWRTGHLSPWARQKWQDDERIATTLIAKRENMRGQANLARKAGPAEQQALAKQFSDIAVRDPVALTRLEAVKLLGSMPVPEAAAGLRAATADREISVRIAAIEGLGNRSDEESVQTLSSLSQNDENSDVRVAATRELAKTGNELALTALEQALLDPDPAMQLTAARSLSETTGQPFGDDIQAWQAWIAETRPSVSKQRTADEAGPLASPTEGFR